MIRVLAPAKLNLFLHVVGKRPDGYHELQTVFQFLDFGDELRISRRDDGKVTGGSGSIPDSQDLSVRAATALQEATGCHLGCDIKIDKRIPIGGGLGGGSSDAASTLLALNELWELHLPTDKLAGIGLTLGADVPVFVHGKAAWAEGVGEQLTPIELPEPWYVVVTPNCEVSTAEVFADPALRRNTPKVSPADFSAGKTGNDFEPVVRKRFPEVARALDWLAPHAPARLSGTGASVFSAFESEAAARQVAEQAPKTWRCIVARGCNRSPRRVA